VRLLTPLKRIGPLGTALTLGQVAMVLRRHWRTIPAEKRERLAHLLRKSKGRLSNLTSEERGELRRLARQLDLARLLRSGALDAAAIRRRLRP
jgi:hypothetical protein